MADSVPPQASPDSEIRGTRKGEGIVSGLWLAVQLVWDMGWIIALPAVAFGFLGAWLDRTYQTTPAFILLGLVLALTLSFLGLKRRLKAILKKRF